MEKTLKLFFTSDVHGYFSPIDYATGLPADTGLANCMSAFIDDGNTLIIDGGDTLQGSPFTYFLQKSGLAADNIPAKVMNIAGYHFYTLGNHDFNYGAENLQRHINGVNAQCLCANVEGLEGVKKSALVTMKNGLKVGITGITTDFINIWEKSENLVGINITDPFPTAEKALAELKEAGADITICIYHGGFECDIATGRRLSETRENQAYKICKELSFDVLLTGHQHIAMSGKRLYNTFICQTSDKAKNYIAGEISVSDGEVNAELKLVEAGKQSCPEALTLLEPYEKKAALWMDSPVGHLDHELLPGDHLDMAANGSLIANFFNQVQLEASGAQISITSLANDVKGFNKNVTIRDIVATYIYPNTLITLEMTAETIKKVLERSAEYFSLDGDRLEISESFLKPKVEHYNYQYLSGIEVVMDIRRPMGERVVSIKYNGEELAKDKKYTVCMNNYLASGTGGYDFIKSCKRIKEEPTEIAELIMDYISSHNNISVDTAKYLTLIV